MAVKEKQDAMLHAIIRVVGKSGFADLKMDDFIKIMPASRSTVYRYFNSRESVIEAVVDEYVDYIERFSVPTDLIIPAEWIAGFQEQLKQSIIFNGNISQQFLADLETDYPDEYRRLQQAINDHDERDRKFYLDGQEFGIFNKQDYRLWMLQDQVMVPKLMDPAFVFARNWTLKDALSNYAQMKAQQVLTPKFLSQFTLDFLDPIIEKISQQYWVESETSLGDSED